MSGPTRVFISEAVVTQRRIVKFGAVEDEVLHATGVADILLGVSTQSDDTAIGDRTDVQIGGIVEVEAGAAFSQGDDITSDGTGRAIAAAPAAGVNNDVVGRALESAAASGDFVYINIQPGRIQGAV